MTLDPKKGQTTEALPEKDEKRYSGDTENIEKDKPISMRYRIMKTVALYMDFFAMGCWACLVGSTLVSMELLLGVTTNEIAVVFIGQSLGFLIGSLLAGVLYDRMNRELLFTLAAVIRGVFIMMSPFTGHLYAYAFCCSMADVCRSITNTGGQAYILSLWQNHKLQGAMIQGVHAVFSVGATVGPLVVRPFLPDLSFLDTTTVTDSDAILSGHAAVTTSGSDVSATSYTMVSAEYYEEKTYYISVLNVLKRATVANTTDISQSIFGKQAVSNNLMNVTRVTTLRMTSYVVAENAPDDVYDHMKIVRFAYVSIGALICIPVMLFLITFVINGHSCDLKQTRNNEKNTLNIPEPQSFRIKFLAWGCILFTIYMWIEVPFSNFLAAFVVKGLGWPNNYGSLIMTTFWGALGIGRVLAVPLSVFINARQIMIGNMVLIFVGALLMFFYTFFEDIIWLAAAAAGFGMSSWFPSTFLWACNYITVTGSASSVFVVASSLGAMTGSYFVGYVFDTVGHMSMVYVLLSATIALFIAYVFVQLYVSCYIKKHGHPKEVQSANASVPDNIAEKEPLDDTSSFLSIA